MYTELRPSRGWDQTGANGANLSFPEEFGLAGGPNPARNQWIVGVINAGYVVSFIHASPEI